MRDPQREAEDYLQEHKILTIFEEMTAALLFHKPQHPKLFLVEFLEEMKAKAATPLLTPRDLAAMFGMFDVMRQGYVTVEQANNALTTILGQKFVDKLGDKGEQDVKTQLTQAEFVQYVQEHLDSFASTQSDDVVKIEA
eukprot:TRINITY_DN2261_c0_g2_i2.p2 TRINITY_DN2261_c0_g2~~TRINITY_DN2261_c0_g2_i2.p2  ORF type:complete len:139 (+),score=22.35 TRINITY_DN2261_c0_g2_i2:222-638(+)